MISFIIPAHDEARLIGATLVSIQAAADALGLAHECIVVDDASGDDTAAIARDLGARVVRVEYRHIAATRNAGARAARGQRLFFVDADTQVDVELVRAALRALDAGAVGGGCTVRLHGPLAWHERLAAAAAVAALRLARIAPGCFQFCTRAAFEATGGYDERWFAAEDIVMSRALARVCRFVLLRNAVHTSSRKLHTFSPREHGRLLWHFLRHGRAMLRSRDRLALWYEKRRH
ncbi:glycosyltransferase involved in cell wall biosynthesis [Lysobacter niabensis]|uniref:Glycosyltransferase involved in cell wall biosynthesis n=1 Tax=Agrilutibacter niabensis TaxID=380628 RepID=A0ABU1VSM4_9GAMM|nr:glycosyltransferase [Lysobacter niabensis]MDR7100491.1 glycosyltransferase involved in cell wall biosynthesis [Lysobacter niabensis]